MVRLQRERNRRTPSVAQRSYLRIPYRLLLHDDAEMRMYHAVEHVQYDELSWLLGGLGQSSR